jgi:hypothetical protein
LGAFKEFIRLAAACGAAGEFPGHKSAESYCQTGGAYAGCIPFHHFPDLRRDWSVRNGGFRLCSCIRPTVCDLFQMKKPLLLFTLACLASCQTNEKQPTDDKPADVKAVKSEIDVSKPESLVGQSLDQVQAACDAREIPHCVVELDGEPRPATMDYRPERLNFKVKDGLITAVTNG